MIDEFYLPNYGGVVLKKNALKLIKTFSLCFDVNYLYIIKINANFRAFRNCLTSKG